MTGTGTSVLEVVALALVAVIQLLSLIVSQVLARRRQRATLDEIKVETAELVRQVSQRPAAPESSTIVIEGDDEP